ncbi:MAG: hypothetical protein Q8K71_17550 [Polaromonas sp.]|nr:hypothetical protein [Polaromonas sp.]MDP3752143.1 hypothetical protein [Polaromonas sp.]
MGKFFDWYKTQPYTKPEHHPLAVMAGFEKTSPSNARRGLLITINDMVEDTADWTPEAVAEADAKFASAGTFTLSEVRRRYSKKYLQILKRGVIRSETEYYLVKGIADGGSIEAGATEGQQIEALMAAFEAKVMQQKGGATK